MGSIFPVSTEKDKRYKINEIVRSEEGIAMASEVLINISKNEIERARLMSELKYELDTQSRLVHAKRTGIQEGIEKGIEKGIKTTARNALAEGAAPEFVQKITGLDMETIKGLANRQ